MQFYSLSFCLFINLQQVAPLLFQSTALFLAILFLCLCPFCFFSYYFSQISIFQHFFHSFSFSRLEGGHSFKQNSSIFSFTLSPSRILLYLFLFFLTILFTSLAHFSLPHLQYLASA